MEKRIRDEKMGGREPHSQTRVAPGPPAPASGSGRPLPPPQSRAQQPPISRLRFEPVDREKVTQNPLSFCPLYEIYLLFFSS